MLQEANSAIVGTCARWRPALDSRTVVVEADMLPGAGFTEAQPSGPLPPLPLPLPLPAPCAVSLSLFFTAAFEVPAPGAPGACGGGTSPA